MPTLKELADKAENQDLEDRQISKLATRLVFDVLRPYIGSGARELSGSAADKLLSDLADITAVLVRANRFRVAGALCMYLHNTLGPTPPCSAGVCDNDGKTCPTGPNVPEGCQGCPSAGQGKKPEVQDSTVQPAIKPTKLRSSGKRKKEPRGGRKN